MLERLYKHRVFSESRTGHLLEDQNPKGFSERREHDVIEPASISRFGMLASRS